MLQAHFRRQPGDNTVNGIDYKYYQRGFGFIPDFSSLTPQLTGTSTSFDISPATRATSFAFNFTGFIYVPSIWKKFSIPSMTMLILYT